MNHARLDLLIIDMNSVDLKYPFMISLNKCTEICNVLSPKMYVPKKTKYIHVKVFNMIANKDEAKAMTEHISCDCKCNFNSTTCNSKQKWNNKTCQWECRNYCKCKENYRWNPSTGICENNKYFKIIADTTVTECDEIIIVMDNVSTKKTNTIATNVTSTTSINWRSKKVRDCYILHRVLLAIILILITTIICYHYAKQKGIKWKIMNFKKVVSKIVCVIISMT